MNRAKSARKVRRTFTLSPENLAYLDQETRRRKADSRSAVLDDLLQEKKLEERRAAIEAQFTAYYDSLSDEEVEEQRAWGEFAEKNLVLSDEENSYGQSAARGDMVRKTADRPSRKRKPPTRHRLSQHTKQSSTR